LLKSVSIKSFVSTEAAHYTAAFQSVKLFLKNFSFLLNRLRFRSELLLVSGRRILQRSKPLSTTSFNRFRSTRPKQLTGLNHHPVSPAHSTRIRPSVQLLFSSNSLNFKEFSERTAPEVVRIIGAQFRASTPFCKDFVILAWSPDNALDSTGKRSANSIPPLRA
jgi:hypothetical protein